MKAQRAKHIFIAALLHLLILSSASFVGFEIIREAPEPVRVQEIGESTIPPAPSEGNPLKDSAEELPKVENDLFSELEETKPARTLENDIINPDAPKPQRELSSGSLGDSREAATDGRRHSSPGEGKIIMADGEGAEGEEKGPAEFYGEPASGQILFVFDASGSMNYNGRIDKLKERVINTIGSLKSTDQFDCYSYNSRNFGLAWETLWGVPKTATKENKQAAINWVKTLNCSGMTPTGEALRHVCSIYPRTLTKLFLVTDGLPNGETKYIVDNISDWWNFTDCKLVCVSIRKGGLPFLRQLADKIEDSKIILE